MAPLGICVSGSAGRMGRTVIECLAQVSDLRLSAALEERGNSCVGRDAGELIGAPCGVAITDDADAAIAESRILVEFTRPQGTLQHLPYCMKHGVNAVIGTTGFSSAEKEQISAASRRIGIVFAPNMSVGVNLTLKLLEVASSVLREGYDIEIIEAHHRHKVDAPSGTALRMGEVIAEKLGRKLADCAVYGREGVTGERKAEAIGFATVRGGDIVGDHTALFAGTGERIEITHRASSRATFAQGALRAARFLADKPNGLYDMLDVLGLR